MGYKSCVKCGNAAVMEWGIKCLRDMNVFLVEMDFSNVNIFKGIEWTNSFPAEICFVEQSVFEDSWKSIMLWINS